MPAEREREAMSMIDEALKRLAEKPQGMSLTRIWPGAEECAREMIRVAEESRKRVHLVGGTAPLL